MLGVRLRPEKERDAIVSEIERRIGEQMCLRKSHRPWRILPCSSLCATAD
jgi:hypothetical protein